MNDIIKIMQQKKVDYERGSPAIEDGLDWMMIVVQIELASGTFIVERGI